MVNTIVEVRFKAQQPAEFLPGYLFAKLSELNEEFRYSKLPGGGNQIGVGQVGIQISGGSLFQNALIRFQLLAGRIIFNLKDSYPGWDVYRVQIEKVLSALVQVDSSTQFSRLGLRYTGIFDGKSLASFSNFKIDSGLKAMTPLNFHFKTEWKTDDIRVIVNLADGQLQVAMANQPSPGLKQISGAHIDIDVILEGIMLFDKGEVMKKLDEMHSKQNDTFYDLLNEQAETVLNIQKA